MAANQVSQQPPSYYHGNIKSSVPRGTPKSSTKSTAPSSPSRVPPGSSFIVKYEELTPDYENQANRAQSLSSGQYWRPPNRTNAYNMGAQSLYRWKGGSMTRLLPNDAAHRASLTKHCCATVFTQEPDTPHIFVVDFDATEQDVKQRQGDWRTLSFEHIMQPNSNNTRTYSSVIALGPESRLAAPASASSSWQEELLPSIYDYNNSIDEDCHTASAGLIGNLGILLALAGLSAPPNSFEAVLTQSVRPGAWVRHNRRNGRIPERGLLVTIYYDPTNTSGWSSKAVLDRIQNGTYGPFYGP